MTAPKPWEETWHITDGNHDDQQDMIVEVSVADENGTDIAWVGGVAHPVLEMTMMAAGNDYARAKLTAAAPDLVRALLAVEWVAQDGCCGEMTLPQCPWCDGYEGRVGFGHHGHTADCQRQAALRKAGVVK